jgi:hypothetical protein
MRFHPRDARSQARIAADSDVRLCGAGKPGASEESTCLPHTCDLAEAARSLGQLTSAEGYTQKQAEYGVNKAGLN